MKVKEKELIFSFKKFEQYHSDMNMWCFAYLGYVPAIVPFKNSTGPQMVQVTFKSASDGMWFWVMWC